jgi:hypothetical protein
MWAVETSLHYSKYAINAQPSAFDALLGKVDRSDVVHIRTFPLSSSSHYFIDIGVLITPFICLHLFDLFIISVPT